jgi:hypothetical protein
MSGGRFIIASVRFLRESKCIRVSQIAKFSRTFPNSRENLPNSRENLVRAFSNVREILLFRKSRENFKSSRANVEFYVVCTVVLNSTHWYVRHFYVILWYVARKRRAFLVWSESGTQKFPANSRENLPAKTRENLPNSRENLGHLGHPTISSLSLVFGKSPKPTDSLGRLDQTHDQVGVEYEYKAPTVASFLPP